MSEDEQEHGHDAHTPQSDDPPPRTDWEVLERALSELLVEEGVVETGDIHRQMDWMDSRGAAVGAQIVAKGADVANDILGHFLSVIGVAQAEIQTQLLSDVVVEVQIGRPECVLNFRILKGGLITVPSGVTQETDTKKGAAEEIAHVWRPDEFTKTDATHHF